MKKLTYKEQLKHPKWIKLAERVKEKAVWRCQECSAIDKPLHAHHLQYVKGRKAWPYAPELLRALCDECHKDKHREAIPEFKRPKEYPTQFENSGKCERCGEVADLQDGWGYLEDKGIDEIDPGFEGNYCHSCLDEIKLFKDAFDWHHGNCEGQS